MSPAAADKGQIFQVRCCRIKGKSGIAYWVRFDGNDPARGADVLCKGDGIGADIGADIDEGRSWRRVLPKKIELGKIVVWVEQRAALRAARQMVQAE